MNYVTRNRPRKGTCYILDNELGLCCSYRQFLSNIKILYNNWWKFYIIQCDNSVWFFFVLFKVHETKNKTYKEICKDYEHYELKNETIIIGEAQNNNEDHFELSSLQEEQNLSLIHI
eukprot:TRINITY_DN32524_c0_g1_i1.p2 TRINITY_DN32524_c0_g1~~TRINITY_DN32524_c0_g1_i1.p2  ORF type:complete len:117 (-),score=6.09 TRINITY_DN32524_c0_g1_i1:122-472(-)